MITLVFFALVIILLVALAVWGISLLTVLPPVPRQILCALVVLCGVYLIGAKAGLW